ncbi:hypothetical protein BDW67DRAFT_166943 [Aspergillus spinulosporus]
MGLGKCSLVTCLCSLALGRDLKENIAVPGFLQYQACSLGATPWPAAGWEALRLACDRDCDSKWTTTFISKIYSYAGISIVACI